MIPLLKSCWDSRDNFWNCSLIPSLLKKRQPWMFSSLQRVWFWSCDILKAIVICRVLWTGIEISGFLCHLSVCMWVCHAPGEAGVSLVFDIQQREQPPCPTVWQNLKLGVCIQSSQVFPTSLTLGSYSWRVCAVWMSYYLYIKRLQTLSWLGSSELILLALNPSQVKFQIPRTR